MATAPSLANRTWGQQDSMAGVFGLVLGVGAGSGMGFSFFAGHQGVKEQGKRQQKKKRDGDTPEVLTLRMGFGGWGIDKVSWEFAQEGVEGTTSDCEFSRGVQYIIYAFDFVLYFAYCRCFA